MADLRTTIGLDESCLSDDGAASGGHRLDRLGLRASDQLGSALMAKQWSMHYKNISSAKQNLLLFIHAGCSKYYLRNWSNQLFAKCATLSNFPGSSNKWVAPGTISNFLMQSSCCKAC